ncbi:MAG: TetR/AcrR family transcriptional regulator, partial [Candidatus Hydrogenedentota bacterium]
MAKPILKNKKSKQRRAEQTKQKILDASLKLFATKGIAATSMRDIAQAASISLGLTYNYFESKDKLVE